MQLYGGVTETGKPIAPRTQCFRVRLPAPLQVNIVVLDKNK